jgi:hypothetical protein
LVANAHSNEQIKRAGLIQKEPESTVTRPSKLGFVNPYREKKEAPRQAPEMQPPAAGLKRRRARTTRRGGRRIRGGVRQECCPADEGRGGEGSISLSACFPWRDWIVIGLGWAWPSGNATGPRLHTALVRAHQDDL